MPSALRASRDFVAHALAKVRSGLSEYEENTKLPGPEIKVEPFDASNVSTPAALIKLGTQIAASRRRKANFAAAQQDVELSRERTRASIALLRAQAERQGQGKPVATISRKIGPYEAGTPLDDIRVDLQNRRLAGEGRGRGNPNTGRVSAAQAGLKELDARMEAEADNLTNSSFAEFAPTFQKAAAGDAEALRSLEIDPEGYVAAYGAEKSRLLDLARQRIQGDLRRIHVQELRKTYTPQRQRYQSVIDQGVRGFSEDGADPNDPLGLGINPLDLFEDAGEEVPEPDLTGELFGGEEGE